MTAIRLNLLLPGLCLAGFCSLASAADLELEPQMVHLRSGPAREWSNFPEQAAGSRWEKRFPRPAGEGERTLWIVQQDVKQGWRVVLNDKPLGELVLDERDLVQLFRVEAGSLAAENVLRIEPKGAHAASDDIRVGRMALLDRPRAEVLSERRVEVEVTDADSGRPIPCCLTIANAEGALVPVGAKSSDELAVRTGIVYTASGRAAFGLPAGEYTLYAGRGFEYSRAEQKLRLDAARPAPPARPIKLTLRREVPVPGYVACDTHIHTLTHSGHGDCTLTERMITLAGEGIELAIATDHNVHVDYLAEQKRLGLRERFTAVIGNEYTTKVGHFNLFPVARGARVPDAKLTDWPAIFREAYGTPGVVNCILNHARDLHSGVRPFGPERFNPAVAEQLDGWPMKFSAMEVLNSGATQTDPLELTRDWMALVNRGYHITPVGSSDSHDVARFVVGQGRTYIRAEDTNPGSIEIDDAMESFHAGRVMVSYGLLCELRVGQEGEAGEVVRAAGENVEYRVDVRVPHWIRADRLMLYMNASVILNNKWRGRTELGGSSGIFTKPTHDFFLTAVATGPGIPGAYWQTAKPYQPTSPDPTTSVYGCSGAIFVDADGDGEWTSARGYAERLWTKEKDLVKLLPQLASYDLAVSQQIAHLFHSGGGDLEGPAFRTALERGAPQVRAGLTSYAAAWRACELARAKRP